jgi:hypothetical protein
VHSAAQTVQQNEGSTTSAAHEMKRAKSEQHSAVQHSATDCIILTVNNSATHYVESTVQHKQQSTMKTTQSTCVGTAAQ